MTYTELDRLTHDALVVSERNEQISRHIEAARRRILLLTLALLLTAVALYYPATARPFAPVAIAAFAAGYALRAVLYYVKRTGWRYHVSHQ